MRNIIILFSFFALLITASSGKDAPPARPGEVTATIAEMKTLAQQMDAAYLDIGFYVTIENLNDLLSDDTVYDFDNIDQYGGTWVLDTGDALFRDQKVELTRPGRLWGGPYVTFQQGRVSIDGDGYDRGSLLDYWGTPYYLFSPAGLVRGDQHNVTQELYGDYFDLWAVVSLGPDGIKSDDDLAWEFGFYPEKLVITSLSAERAYPGEALTLRGYNMGSPGGARSVPELLLSGEPVESVLSWSATEVTFAVPSGAESGELKVSKDGEESNALYLTVTERPTSAESWNLYR